jgi:hypothetical protein
VKHARFNLAVVLVLLAAFLLVQADLPISQAVTIRPPVAQQCCCSLEMQKRAACCCCSMGTQTKSGCSLRTSSCGENGSTGDTIIVVKFQIVLPVLTVALLQDVTQTPTLSAVTDATARPTEPPVPPPRLLIPA